MRFTSLILAMFLAAAALPARAETVADIEAAWRGWMTMNGRGAGGIAVMRRGRLAHQAAMGGEAVSNAVPLASLSKAVTGVCIAGLIDRGRLSFDTPLSQALARTFARLGAPADPRFPGITIGQLLVHRAGFDRAGSNQVEDGDPVTGQLRTYLRTATATRPSFDEQMKWVLRRRLPLAPGERYAYTNAAYLVLGAVIEERAGRITRAIAATRPWPRWASTARRSTRGGAFSRATAVGACRSATTAASTRPSPRTIPRSGRRRGAG